MESESRLLDSFMYNFNLKEEELKKIRQIVQLKNDELITVTNELHELRRDNEELKETIGGLEIIKKKHNIDIELKAKEIKQVQGQQTSCYLGLVDSEREAREKEIKIQHQSTDFIRELKDLNSMQMQKRGHSSLHRFFSSLRK